MIGFLSGTIQALMEKKVIILTSSGVGYELHCGEHTNYEVGQQVSFYTTTIIKENSHDLFGFESIDEKQLFELLLSVTGVGPKSAFALLSYYTPQDVMDMILMGDSARLKKAPGIGAKASEQIILDLSKKITQLRSQVKLANSLPGQDQQQPTPQDSNRNEGLSTSVAWESLEALRQLGFQDKEVLPLIKSFMDGKSDSAVITAQDCIKIVLKEMRN